MKILMQIARFLPFRIIIPIENLSFKSLIKYLITFVLVIPIALGSVNKLTWAQSTELKVAEREYQEALKEINRVLRNLEEAKRQKAEADQKALEKFCTMFPVHDCEELQVYWAEILKWTAAGITLAAMGPKLGAVYVIKMLAVGYALDELQLQPDEIKNLDKAKQDFDKLKAELDPKAKIEENIKSINKEIKKKENCMQQNEGAVSGFGVEQTQVKEDKKPVGLTIEPQELTLDVDKSNFFKAMLKFGEGKPKDVSNVVEWKPESIFHGRAKWADFKPGKHTVTVTYKDAVGSVPLTAKATLIVKDRPPQTKPPQQQTSPQQPPSQSKLVSVPDVVGLSQDAAEYDIKDAGLQVGEVRKKKDPERAGVVIAQSPEKGKQVSAGSRVTLTVSLGTPPAIRTLYVDPPNKTIEMTEKPKLRALLWYTDGREEDVTDKATWAGADRTGLFTPTKPGKFQITASFSGFSGSATITVRESLPPQWSSPLSHADEIGARAEPSPPSHYTWYVMCEKKDGAVVYGEYPDVIRHHVMAGPFEGPRTATWWIEGNCPRWRCTAEGACAKEPAYVSGGKWAVVCDKKDLRVYITESPELTRHWIMKEGFLGGPDADLWIQKNCPNRLCTDGGGCAKADAPRKGGKWAVVCDKNNGSVGLTEYPNVVSQWILGENFFGEVDARMWANQKCPSWRCDQDGKCGDAPRKGGKWAVVCDKSNGVVGLTEYPNVVSQWILDDHFFGEVDARMWANKNCPTWRCNRDGKCLPGSQPIEGAGGRPLELPPDFSNIGSRFADRQQRRDQEVGNRRAADASRYGTGGSTIPQESTTDQTSTTSGGTTTTGGTGTTTGGTGIKTGGTGIKTTEGTKTTGGTGTTTTTQPSTISIRADSGHIIQVNFPKGEGKSVKQETLQSGKYTEKMNVIACPGVGSRVDAAVNISVSIGSDEAYYIYTIRDIWDPTLRSLHVKRGVNINGKPINEGDLKRITSEYNVYVDIFRKGNSVSRTYFRLSGTK